MEKRSMAVAVAALVVAVVAGVASVFAVTGSDDPSNGPTTVTVASTASVGTAPDQAAVTVEVLAEDEVAADAYEQGQTDTAAVLAAVEAAGVAREDIRTTDVGLDRVVRDRRTPQERTVFVARNRLEITVTDLDSIGAVVSAAVDGGADRIGGVRFEVADEAAARSEAIAAAVRAARGKAETMAQAAGAELGDVVRIDEGRIDEPVYEQRGSFALGAAADEAIVPPDELDTTVTVSVVWALEG
jgi:hypothetical protein